MEINADLFSDIVVIFIAAFLAGATSRLVRLPALVGYLAVGMAVGPHGFGFVSAVDEVRTLAEFGVVLLLFVVGVEVSTADLRRAGLRVLIAGAAQITISAGLGILVGFALGWSAEQSVVFGMVLSLSSTMVVLKVLSDRGEVQSLSGRVMTGMLVVQDLAFVPMIAIIPALAGEDSSVLTDVGIGIGKAAVVLGAIFLLGGRGVPWVLRRAARLGSGEAFVVTVVALAFAAAALTEYVGLSAALGAFAAGLVVSETDWTGHRVLQEVTPLRDIFAAMFFVSLGMLTDPQFLVDEWALVVGIVAIAIIVKAVVVAGLVYAVGFLPRVAIRSGSSMVQIGEFSFILAGTADVLGIVDGRFLPLTVVAAVVTMAITPATVAGGARVLTRLERRYRILRPYVSGVGQGERAQDRLPRLRGHVVVTGLGRIGSFLAQELDHSGIPFIGIDTDPAATARLERLNGYAIQGDSVNPAVLDAARVDRARLLIVTTPDPVSALVTVQQARRMNPELRIVGRVSYREEADLFRAVGVDSVVWPEMEAALEILRASLVDMGVSEQRLSEAMIEARDILAGVDLDQDARTDPYAGLW